MLIKMQNAAFLRVGEITANATSARNMLHILSKYQHICTSIK